MPAAVTAFVFSGLHSAGQLEEHAWLLDLPGFASRWATVAAAFADAPGFTMFDAALRAGAPLPHVVGTWTWRALAVTAMQLAAAEALEDRGEHADWLCGYSLGDIARSLHARVATFAQLVAFAAALPSLPGAAGVTLGVVARDARVLAPLRRRLRALGVAVCRLSPRFLMFAGDAGQAQSARLLAARSGAHVREIGDCPLHAPVLAATARVLATAARHARLSAATRAMFSTLWGRGVTPADDLRREFTTNVAAPIDFARAIARLRSRHGVTRFVDLGPGRHAGRFVRHHGGEVHVVHCHELLAVTAP